MYHDAPTDFNSAEIFGWSKQWKDPVAWFEYKEENLPHVIDIPVNWWDSRLVPEHLY